MLSLVLLASLAVEPLRKTPDPVFTLRVLTYNIQGLPNDDESSHERYGRIGKILKERRDAGAAPHVVFIQEAFHPRTQELIEEAGYPHHRFGAPGHSGAPLSSGLVILSEFPIERAATIDYVGCTGFDCWANKGAQHARLLIPGLPVPLDVFNTHMNAGDEEHNRDVRKQQLKQLLPFIKAHRGAGSPALMSGDFNFRRGDSDYALFTAGANAAESCAQHGCEGAADPLAIARESVDHHFYARGERVDARPTRFEQTFTEEPPLSDHVGLEAWFTLASDGR